MLAYGYPLLNITWTIIIFFFVASIFFAVVYAFIDNFRRRDHSGGAKALWALVIIILPLLGACIYILSRPADVG